MSRAETREDFMKEILEKASKISSANLNSMGLKELGIYTGWLCVLHTHLSFAYKINRSWVVSANHPIPTKENIDQMKVRIENDPRIKKMYVGLDSPFVYKLMTFIAISLVEDPDFFETTEGGYSLNLMMNCHP